MKINLFLVSVFILSFCYSLEYKLEPASSGDWKLKSQEEAEFSVKLSSRDHSKAPFSELNGRKIRYIINVDGLKKKEGIIISGAKDAVVKYSLPHPGWINLNFILLDDSGKEFEYQDKSGRKKKVSAGIGALVEPEKLRPGMKRPDDFDQFWDAQREILNKVPMKAVLTEVEPAPPQKGKFRCYDVQVTCAGDMPVSGYLSVPCDAKEKSLPAVVSFHGAGVYSSNKSINPEPALYLDVNSHGIPNGKPKDYYRKMAKVLGAYWHRGADDRETFYFRGMFFRVMRALDYIKSRPEWNGKVLIVTGSSMGGAQSLAAAGLDSQVTHCIVSVPALMDHGGSLAEIPRKPGWPTLFDARRKTPIPGRVKTAPYYDNVFFVDRMKCNVYLSAGLNDFVCCPTSIYVLYNRLPAKKRSIEIYPVGAHSTSFNTRRFIHFLNDSGK